MKKVIQGLFTLSCTFLINNVSAAEEPMIELDTVEVFGVTPLSGSGVSLDKIPSNVQVVDSKQLQDAQSTSLADYINRYLAGVHINEAQNNPLQPDVYYRGFVASPLLGLPQGLSVYVNGVRFNEPFGDTVNWDLIPQGAIDTMSLFPGSNPVFGLNTLGGALSIKTKTGFSAPGHQLEVSGGSWERHSEELTSGWNDGTWGYFIDLHHFEENGWRDYSPTEANQVFGTLSWRGDRGELDLTLGANDNNMKGNGAVPTQLHQEQRKAIFTHPDQTITRMFFSELSGLFDVTDTVQLSGNAYFRQNRIKSFNGDDSDFEACDDPNNQFICDEDDEIVDDLEGNSVLVSDVYGPLDPEDTLGSTNNTSQTYMRSSGGTFQSMFSDDIFGYQNNLIFGAAYDYADVHFESDTELGLLTESRGTTGSGVLVEEAHVRLNTVTKTYGIYFSDSFSVTDDLTVTLAGRYNHSKITLNNQYINGEDKLSGEHSFDRFNPSAGFTYQVVDSVGLYGSYSESARVPTPMELSCADEDDPCKLPNAFIADPPLDQVVAKTWEAGVRGNLNDFISDGDVNWNIGFFHTINHDDIIFNRGGDSISEGYFSNIGQTRRYGIETGLSANFPALFSDIDDWHFSTNYTYLNARFLDGFMIQNPLDLEGEEGIKVDHGDRIPGLPEHLYKASLGVDLWQRWSLGIDAQFSGEQYLRGDEAMSTDPLGGYWVFNATTEFKVNEHVVLFGKLDNILDRDYKSFGVYGDATEVLGDEYDNGRFVSPGMPRAGWVGIRLSI